MRSNRARIATLLTLIVAGQTTLWAHGSSRNTAPANTDWSKAVVDSTIKRFPTAESLKGWGYAKSLYLYGEYLVYLRTHDKRYLDHVKAWIDLHVDSQGVISRPINSLDYMLPGNLLL